MRCGKSLTSKSETVTILHSTEEVIFFKFNVFGQLHLDSVPWSMVGTPSDTVLEKKIFFFANTYLQRKILLHRNGNLCPLPLLFVGFLSGAVCNNGIAFRTECCREGVSECHLLVLFNFYCKEKLKQPPCPCGLFALFSLIGFLFHFYLILRERGRDTERWGDWYLTGRCWQQLENRKASSKIFVSK